jgi:hypothetical protein
MRDDEDFTYRYFLIGTVNPVRVKYDANGSAFYAENAHPTHPGKLKNSVTLISVIWKDEDVDEITEEQFHEQCKRVWKEGPWRPRGDANMRR